MTQTENPYQAPEVVIPVRDETPMPAPLKVVIALYVAYCVMGIVSMRLGAAFTRTVEMFVVVGAANAAYSAFACFALMKRWPWAWWLMVLTTGFAVLGLALMARRGQWDTYWMVTLAYVLRIVIGVLLFHPAIRHWFARRRA